MAFCVGDARLRTTNMSSTGFILAGLWSVFLGIVAFISHAAGQRGIGQGRRAMTFSDGLMRFARRVTPWRLPSDEYYRALYKPIGLAAIVVGAGLLVTGIILAAGQH